MNTGICGECGEQSYLVPLHGPKGDPLRCFVCAGRWNAMFTRRRKLGRVIIKAMKLFESEGGARGDIEKLSLASTGWVEIPGYEDTLGEEIGDITLELLDDTLQLTHPDRHPPERREMAQRVTRELLGLRPFVFPAPKPEPPEPPSARDGDTKFSTRTFAKPSQAYPCELCIDEAPGWYCDACRAEWDKRQEEKRKRENERQRKWYALRRKRCKARRSRVLCAACGKNEVKDHSQGRAATEA